MSDDDIDLDRVVVDPEYRRKVIAFLNAAAERGTGVDEERRPARAPAMAAD